jgi:NADH-quinone oxidoreductase subunit N
MNALIILAGLSIIMLFSEMLNYKKALLPIAIIGLTAALIANILAWNTNIAYYNDMMVVDNYSIAFTGLLIVITLLWFVMSPDYFHEPSSRTDHFSLIIFALIGAQLLTSFGNLLMLFLAIEILSIPIYILAGSNKLNLSSNEASLKYFMMGAFATGFLLFGIALIYGITGSFHLENISQYLNEQGANLPFEILIGVILIIVGLAFKVSAVPFHFWTPDVYTGSPTVITAFMSTVVKVAAFAGFFRLFSTCFNTTSSIWQTTIWSLAALTIIIGNITAVFQTNFKRLLAYSSIVHAGYMLLAILAIPGEQTFAQGSIYYYAVAYAVSSITAFAVLLLISHVSKSDSIESFNGLAKRNPLLSFVTVVAMLSLAGIPPLAGFFAKYYIFTAALQQGYVWLVIIAVLGSLIGVYYYFKIIIALFKQESEETIIPINTAFKVFLVATSIAALFLGIMPDVIAGIF